MQKKMQDITFTPNQCEIKDKKLYCNESSEEIVIDVNGEKPESGNLVFVDGKIGIFDTKSGWTAEDATQKANGLQRYISEHKDLNLFGGIINVVNGSFYLNNDSDYEFGDGKTGQWKLFEI